MGWLGWSYDQTLDTPMPVIELAMRGLVEKLTAIHGTGEVPATTAAAVPLSSIDEVKAVFRSAARPK